MNTRSFCTFSLSFASSSAVDLIKLSVPSTAVLVNPRANSAMNFCMGRMRHMYSPVARACTTPACSHYLRTKHYLNLRTINMCTVCPNLVFNHVYWLHCYCRYLVYMLQTYYVLLSLSLKYKAHAYFKI
ncbi:hypothetical protein BDA96_10G353900 [Sorghum bicolor]|uniref:Uncharacterized protein n=2 Tax=Sorghum bicolor TaxID=4558 RepID=A0A921Q673_SORBI|nr:hypothetical protein BDA96_10G353900 [Sorghum bicolor]OQU77169.1 hypothetical protein SORBI_3010G275550 [Sorghum bicolor]